MREKNNIWNNLVEEIILGYRKWWKQEWKEKAQKLLLNVLKRKYEYSDSLLRQDREMLKNKDIMRNLNKNMKTKKSQEIFTTDSIKDPATRERWRKAGLEDAKKLIESLKQGIRNKVKTP